MRMIERRSPIERVEVGFRTMETAVLGRIVTVGQDHLVIADDQGQDWITPLASISYVARRTHRSMR